MHTAAIRVPRSAPALRPAGHRVAVRPVVAAVAAAVVSAGLFVLALGPGEEDSAPTTTAGPPSSLQFLGAP